MPLQFPNTSNASQTWRSPSFADSNTKGSYHASATNAPRGCAARLDIGVIGVRDGWGYDRRETWIRAEERAMEPAEIARLQAYFRKKFGANTLSVRPRGRIKDSAEVYLGDEHIGVISRDDEDGEVSYDFHMAILDMDLEDVA